MFKLDCSLNRQRKTNYLEVVFLLYLLATKTQFKVFLKKTNTVMYIEESKVPCCAFFF